jgi:hypothetical protein
MNTKIDENKLPDWDDLIVISHEIGKLKTELAVKEYELDALLADITNVVSSEKEYWVGGKVPSATYIKTNYHLRGLNEGQREVIKNLRMEIANIEGTLKSKELELRALNTIIDIWRTQSANERKVVY